MSNLVNTYGKTWHTWHTEQNQNLPMGAPALMMGFTADGQLNPALLADRDRRFGVNTEAIKKERADMPAHPVAKGADAWEQGQVIQIKPVKLSAKGDQHFH